MRTLHALAAVFAVSLACSPVLAQKAPVDATVSMIREAGVAMTAWMVEHAAGSPTTFDGTATRTSFDWSACPTLTRAEARRLLGRGERDKLPKHDGWGHALEYCLQSGDTAAGGHRVGVRSPGHDGRFDGTTYAPAAFDPEGSDRDDIVWMDGVFVTWPERR